MKKAAVIVLFMSVVLGLFFLKNKFEISSGRKTPEKVIFSWEHSPKKITLDTPLELTFYLKDLNNNPISNAKIEIEANMNHSGMVPLFSEAINIKDAVYKTRLTLTMRGDWIFFLTIKLPSGEMIKKEVTLKTE